MAMKVDQLEGEMRKLSLEARPHLAEKLILSLDAPTEEESLRLWVAEAERGLTDLHEGKGKVVTLGPSTPRCSDER